MTTLHHSIGGTRALRGAAVATLIYLLAACASSQAYREGNSLLAAGNVEQGLAKLEEAAKADPRNVEYRIALVSQRNAQVNRLLAAGEAHQRDGRLSESEKSYRQVLAVDTQNPMAQQGLEALVVERRHRQAVSDAEALFKKGGETQLGDALERLRPVLAENPQQKEALNLKARINEARAQLPRAETKLAAAFRKPISLEFRDVPLKSVFDVIAKVSGLNIFFDKDLRPDLKATVLAKNTSIEDAVRLLLVTNQLEQRVLNENSILIYPATPQKLKDYQTLAVRSFYLSNADVKAVANSIKTLVKTKDLVIDERLGIIMMRDTPDAIRMAERIVALQDLSDPEVMLEVEVMEVKRSRLLDLGVQWPTSVSLAPLQVQGAPLTLNDLRNLNRSTIQASVGSLTVTARKEDQDSNILANPRIRVRNKEKAKVLIGDRVPVITTTSTSTGFVSESVNYVDVGLKLEVEPTIYLDDEVAIKVNLEVSSLVKEVLSKSGSLAYQIGTRGATTVLRLKDGETQILAGLISDEDRSSGNKLPGVGDLPLVGRLFGAQKGDVQRSEILLSITPRIVRAIRRPDLAAAEFESGTESNIGAAPLRLTAVEPEKTDARPALVPAVTRPPASSGLAPSAPPAAPPAAATPAASGSVVLSWQAPAQIKVGEQFSAALRITSQGGLRGLPVLLAFDPQLLQVAAVQEGPFFKQGGGNTHFSQRIDAAQGKVFVTVVRQNAAGADAGVNGMGNLATVTFKAIKAGNARLQLLSASPEPAPATPLNMPVEQIVRIVP